MKTDGQKKSQMHEKRLAKVMGGTVNAGSGSFWVRKGDVRTDKYLVEHKYTGKQSFTLKASVLETIMTEALLSGRVGLVGISLNNKNYVVLDENDWLELIADEPTA